MFNRYSSSLTSHKSFSPRRDPIPNYGGTDSLFYLFVFFVRSTLLLGNTLVEVIEVN